jgi:acetylornithine aminotransferase
VLIAARQANAAYLKASHPDEPAPADVSAALERHANVTLTTYSRPPMILTRGKGLKVYDTQEREYLDLSAGIAVNALGHADEQVARVIYEQVYLRAASFRKLSPDRPFDWCTARTCTITSGPGSWRRFWSTEHCATAAWATTKDPRPAKSFARSSPVRPTSHSRRSSPWSDSGTESNEGALKFVRKFGKTAPGKHEIVCFHNGFHGRSMGALSATMQSKYQEPFAPLIPGFKAGHLNDVDGIDALVTDKACGVIVEPIQVRSALPAYAADVQRRARAALQRHKSHSCARCGSAVQKLVLL